jgi:hypothetical protein
LMSYLRLMIPAAWITFASTHTHCLINC